MSPSRADRLPLPTLRFVAFLALASVPALASVAWPGLARIALGLDGLLILAFAFDALRGAAQRVEGSRPLPERLLAFCEGPLELQLENRGAHGVRGSWIDATPSRWAMRGGQGTFQLAPGERLTWRYALRGPPRGRARLGDVHLRIAGPWGLAARQTSIAASGEVRCLTDLREPREALLRARPQIESGLARLRRKAEGRELDALRLYRPGDDLRVIDWKASARRGELVSRELLPERNQTVLLMVDCGRQMVAREGDRTKLDHALEAALRLARTCLERGDAVGLLAFDTAIRSFVGPAKSGAQLRSLLTATSELEPVLEESDYAAAFDLLQRQTPRRALVCVFTDLKDDEASKVLLARTLALRPRHLPVVITLIDAALATLEREVPGGTEAAFTRAAATRLLRDRAAVRARLQRSGATVVSARSGALSAEAINAYLRIKERGLL